MLRTDNKPVHPKKMHTQLVHPPSATMFETLPAQTNLLYESVTLRNRFNNNPIQTPESTSRTLIQTETLPTVNVRRDCTETQERSSAVS